MRLTSLGSGGGRVVVDTQALPTGGYRVSTRSGLEMHVDPGPGAQLHALARRLSCDPFTLNALFLSHNHLDHMSDAGVMVECMTFGKKFGTFGTVLAPTSVLKGLVAKPSRSKQAHVEYIFDKGLQHYFQKMAGRVEELKAGKTVELTNPDVVPYDGERDDLIEAIEQTDGQPGAQAKTAKSSKPAGTAAKQKKPTVGARDVIATLTATKSDHEDTSGVGFILKADGASLGYTSDTNAFDGLAEQFDGVSCWLVNCIEPFDKHIDYHLSANDVVDALNSMSKKPAQVVLSHFGMTMLKAGPAVQAKKVEDATGVKTLASQLGLVVPVE